MKIKTMLRFIISSAIIIFFIFSLCFFTKEVSRVFLKNSIINTATAESSSGSSKIIINQVENNNTIYPLTSPFLNKLNSPGYYFISFTYNLSIQYACNDPHYQFPRPFSNSSIPSTEPYNYYFTSVCILDGLNYINNKNDNYNLSYATTCRSEEPISGLSTISIHNGNDASSFEGENSHQPINIRGNLITALRSNNSGKLTTQFNPAYDNF